MKICPNCQLANDDRNYQCPRCGFMFFQPVMQPYLPPKRKSSGLAIAIISIILSLFVYFVFASIADIQKEDEIKNNIPDYNRIDNKLSEFNYKKIERNIDKYDGEYYKIKVEIFQKSKTSEFGAEYYYKAYTEDNDLIWLFDYQKYTKYATEKILEGDVIYAYIQLDGTIEIENFINGATEDVPKFNLYYADLIE